MKLTIRRGPSTDFGTFSKAVLAADNGSGGMSFDWLELPWRNNAPKLSCIQLGTYRAIAWDSPTFGIKVYRLICVPARTDILIHPGNWAGDTTLGWHSDLLGCMAPGHEVGELPHNGKMQRALLHSGDALKELMKFTGGQPLDIQIIGFGAVGV